MNQDIRFCTTDDGVKLAYAVSGEGPPLVMSATWLTHLEHQWQSMAWRPWLDFCSGGHTLVRYDSRGCGLSDRDTDNFSFENWIKDFECVIEASGLRKFSLLGTCWGGPIAIEYAARYPERVDRLILYGTYARGRMRWNNRPQETEKQNCCLTLLVSAGDVKTTPFSRSGRPTPNLAARLITYDHGATSSALQLPRPPFACFGLDGTWT